MRALDESLRAPPPTQTGKAGARAGGKEQAPGGFEDAVATAGRQKANGQGAQGSIAGSGDAAEGDHSGAATLIGNDGIKGGDAKISISKPTHRAPGDLEDPTPENQNAQNERFSLAAREKDAKRLAAARATLARENAGAPDLAGDTDDVAARIAALSRGLGKSQAGGPQGVDGNSEATDGQAASDAKPLPNASMDDLLTLLGGNAMPSARPDAQGGAAGPADAHAIGDSNAKGAAHGDMADAHGANAEGAEGEQGTDRLFRFARADGKGQAISMSISKDGEHATVDAARSNAKAENVTVLEARRYLGISMSTNSTNVTSAIAGDAGFAQSLQPSTALGQPGAWAQAGKTLNTLKIQMHPIELGLVTATLRLKDDELQVELKVENADAFRQLRDDQSEMVKALRAQGFAVDQINVVFNSGSDASTGGGSSQQQAQAGQQSRERAEDGGGQGRQRQNGDSQASMAERRVGNGGTDDAVSGTERSRTGHVYM
ncbi:flagellar hook-length control protein FliK [Ensifer sp. HO-A22]|uniref:Flagellar hook-length control protein FliK n=1 Tax=Ensifer oleiphilus TaxID=2742698 RepID=A0A7Y6Q2C8_9HYPH|nr:flagellar hook-length control protein FliK [Ensifer oleiphilus]NVD37797.1 flagellar hook-length control protein FliK [Ensifer oleiphilus]